MSISQLRVAAARESLADTPVTEEEKLMVAPPDAAMADPVVASAILEDQATGEELQNEVQALTQDGAEAAGIISQLEGDDVTPMAAAVAAERLGAIFSRYPELPGLSRMRAARESMQDAQTIDTKDVTLPPSYTVDELIDESKQNLEFMQVAANEGLKEMANRVAVNVRDIFRFNTTYAKVAVKVKQLAQQTTGTPSDAKYTNAVRIAHFTTADKRVLANARDLSTSMGKLNKNIATVAVVAERLSEIFMIIKNDDGLDLKGLFNGVDMVDGRISLSGDGLFGEEFYLTDISLREATNLRDLVEACKNIRVNNDNVWTVKELQADGLMELPVLSSKEIVANIDAAINAANMIPDEAKTAQRIIAAAMNARSSHENHDVGSLLTDIVTKREFFFAADRIASILRAMGGAVSTVISNKTKALNCLLDYYEWSLKQHKAVGTEGFIGGLGGFILGSFTWATVIGSGAVGGATAQAAATLQKKIKATAEEIARINNADVENAVKNEVFTQKMADAKKVDANEIIKGAVLGVFFSPFVAAINMSRIEDRVKELERLTVELQKLEAKAREEADKAKNNQGE